MAVAPPKHRERILAARSVPRPPDLAMIPFDMPRPTAGMTVNFYPRCSVHGDPVPCSVVKVSGPRHVLIVPHGVGVVMSNRGVRHALDPITGNPNEQPNGCWDFTDEYYERQAKDDELETFKASHRSLLKWAEEVSDSLGIALPELGVPEPEEEEGPIELTDEEKAKIQADLEAAMVPAGLVQTVNSRE